MEKKEDPAQATVEKENQVAKKLPYNENVERVVIFWMALCMIPRFIEDTYPYLIDTSFDVGKNVYFVIVVVVSTVSFLTINGICSQESKWTLEDYSRLLAMLRDPFDFSPEARQYILLLSMRTIFFGAIFGMSVQFAMILLNSFSISFTMALSFMRYVAENPEKIMNIVRAAAKQL
jgi:hypothetical protein